MNRVIIVLLLAALVPSPAAATDVDGDGEVWVLLPIAFPAGNEILGAHGSVWRMQLWLQNRSALSFLTLQPTGGCFPPCESPYVPGFVGLYPAINSNGGAGAILRLPASAASQVDLSARLLETSRRAQPTGVDLPVVREEEFFRGSTSYLGIPVGSTIRSTLRVYDPRLVPGSTIRVDILDESGTIIATRRLYPGNDPVVTSQDRRFIQSAGVDAILDITAAVPLLNERQHYHIVLTPETAGIEYWAFVSVTDNESQHVLLVTAQ